MHLLSPPPAPLLLETASGILSSEFKEERGRPLPRQKRRKRSSAEYTPPRRSKPPFPISLLFNVKAFYFFFIIIMIASVAAVGIGPTFGGGSSAPPPPDDAEASPSATPVGSIFPDGPEQTTEPGRAYTALLKTNKGDIELQLFADAPQAVNSFAFLASKDFFDGQIFFFIDKGFVAQAGDPTCRLDDETSCTGVGGPGYNLPFEKTAEKHQAWSVVAPALQEGQEVHGSQFRILYDADPRLDGKETVFGQVVSGQQILESLSNFVPCSVIQSQGCAVDPTGDATLVIEDVTVQAT